MLKTKSPKQLMKCTVLVGGTLLMLAATPVQAADDAGNDPGALYRANELSVDAFGTAGLGKYTISHLSGARVRHNARLGAGAGVSYFVTRNVGFGADAYSENTTGPLIDSASVNLILRLPLGESGFAPYALGGGGHQFDAAKLWFAQFGGGLEYRFTRNIGAFVDARIVLPHETKYYGAVRLGMRFAF
jgi:hypothetical protein